MTKAFVILLVVVAQVVFLSWTLLLLIMTRGRRWSERKEDERAGALLAEPVRRVILGEASVDEIAAVLRRFPHRVAARHFVETARGRLPPAAADDLARMVRGDRWVRRALAGARSRWWWRRLDAARLLSAIADESDAPLVERLLLDEHPAVVIAINPALARAATPALIAVALDTIHRRPLAVRQHQGLALRKQWAITEPLLAERLRTADDSKCIRVFIALADALDSPSGAVQALRFASHPVAEVRITTARALAKCFHPDAVPALRRLLTDGDWRVRVQAARSLGALGAHAAIDQLSSAMSDESWWVRFRAALALAAFGERGRAVLARMTASDDPFASDMATFIGELSEGSRIELSAR